jgi:hypothetical protein
VVTATGLINKHKHYLTLYHPEFTTSSEVFPGAYTYRIIIIIIIIRLLPQAFSSWLFS